MRRALLLAALAPLAAQAQPAEELAFWESARGMDSPAAYQAYLNAYPAGAFAPLARLRLGPAPVPAVPAPAAASLAGPAVSGPATPGPQAPAAAVWLRPAKATVRLTDGIALDLDATGLRAGSNHRLIAVAADAPEAVADAQAFAAGSTPIEAKRLRLTIPPGPPGQGEVRLYYVPRFEGAFTLAARVPVTVLPGAPGAVLARDLVREAASFGPLRFEALHRDRPLLVQAGFLRIRPRTEWNVRWFGGGLQEVPLRAAVISIGLPGAAPDGTGSRGEVVCVLAADDPATLNRLAALNTGDPVLVRGVPTMWDGGEGGPLVLSGCGLEG